MKKIKRFSDIILMVILLSSCGTSINKENPTINSEENTNNNINTEKKRMEIKFSCGREWYFRILR